MIKQYAKEELEKIYKTLPNELKEAAGSLELVDSVDSICERNNITDEAQIEKIVDLIGYVLLGILLPDDFTRELSDTVKLEKKIAPVVSREINRLIFYPVKPALEQLHSTEIGKKESVAPSAPEARVIAPQAAERPAAEAPSAPTTPQKEDTYREPLE